MSPKKRARAGRATVSRAVSLRAAWPHGILAVVYASFVRSNSAEWPTIRAMRLAGTAGRPHRPRQRR